MMSPRLLSIACVLSILLFVVGRCAWATPNILFILTDDQRFDTVSQMPVVLDRIAQQGVSFTNAYVSTPQCGPARASINAGGFYAHNTGVLTINQPNGGWEKLDDSNTLATALSAAGYDNGLVGKYFSLSGDSYTPPGWNFFDPRKTLDTEVMKDRAIDFLNQHSNGPFFLYFSTVAPHHPATPAAEDAALFPGYVYRDRGYGEQDLSDKPGWLQNSQPGYDTNYFLSLEEQDEFHRDQLRTLQGVDRAIDEILSKIDELGELDNTVIIFTSDNGYLWGEHGLYNKNKPYEESIRVPLIISGPGISPRTEDKPVVMNLDIGPTIRNLAGVPGPTDGLDLMPLLQDSGAAWRDDFLIEQYRRGIYNNAWSNAVWAGVVSDTAAGRWKYFEYANGVGELYDLDNDPYELESQHNNPQHAAIKAQLIERLDDLRGLAITSSRGSTNYPAVNVGDNFFYKLTAWGGDGNYSWSVIDGGLPPGVQLDNVTGAIQGVPTQAGQYTVVVQVDDTALIAHTGATQKIQEEYIFDVGELDTDGDGLPDSLELAIGTNPNLADTDSDNLNDGFEVAFDGVADAYVAGQDLNPLSADTDGDGLTDGFEVAYDGIPGTYVTGKDLDPLNLDTDGDSLNDGYEVANSSDPLVYTNIPANGDLNSNGNVDAGDVLLQIQIALDLITPTAEQLLRGDLAPVVNGTLEPDGTINAADVMRLLRIVIEQDG